MSTATEKPTIEAHIRWMIRRDMEEVLAIEGTAFEYPWTEEDFVSCLRRRNCIGMVAERDDRVLGYMVYELHKTRIHLLNFAVRPSDWGRGIGRQLVRKLKSKLSSQRRTRLSLEIRESNLDAQLFFRAMGFRATSTLRDFYDESREDAYLFQYYHPTEAPTP